LVLPLGPADRTHYEWRQHGQELSGFSGIEPGGVAQPGLHRFLSSTKHVAQNAGTGAPLGVVEESRDVIQNSAVVVLRNCVMERLGLGSLSSIAGDGCEEKR
jgi:hypothetical protein